jgi:hypothetical protein
MAFAYTHIAHDTWGKYVLEICSFTNAEADVGGDVTFRYLKRVIFADIQEQSAGAVAAGATINETFPLAGNVVTIVTQAHSDGYIAALGIPD